MSTLRRLLFAFTVICYLNSTALAFLPLPNLKSSPSDVTSFSQTAFKKYQGAQTVGELAQAIRPYLNSKDQNFLNQQIKNIAHSKPLKASLARNEFSLSDGKNVFQMKVLDMDRGAVEINHHTVQLSFYDLKKSWQSIEQALPKAKQAMLFNLLISEAHADNLAFLTAIAVIGLIGLHAFANIAWHDHKLSLANRSCEQAKNDRILTEGPKSPEDKEHLQKFLNSLTDAKMEECEDPDKADSLCRDSQKLAHCLDEIKPLVRRWLDSEKTEGALQQAPSKTNSVH